MSHGALAGLTAAAAAAVLRRPDATVRFFFIRDVFAISVIYRVAFGRRRDVPSALAVPNFTSFSFSFPPHSSVLLVFVFCFCLGRVAAPFYFLALMNSLPAPANLSIHNISIRHHASISPSASTLSSFEALSRRSQQVEPFPSSFGGRASASAMRVEKRFLLASFSVVSHRIRRVVVNGRQTPESNCSSRRRLRRSRLFTYRLIRPPVYLRYQDAALGKQDVAPPTRPLFSFIAPEYDAGRASFFLGPQPRTLPRHNVNKDNSLKSSPTHRKPSKKTIKTVKSNEDNFRHWDWDWHGHKDRFCNQQTTAKWSTRRSVCVCVCADRFRRASPSDFTIWMVHESGEELRSLRSTVTDAHGAPFASAGSHKQAARPTRIVLLSNDSYALK